MPETTPISRRVIASSALALVGAGFALRERPDDVAAAPLARAQPALPAETTAPVARTVDRAALTAELDAYLATRGGTLGLFVRDQRSGETFEWQPFTNESLSTIKVLILIACLRKVQDSGAALTDAQHNQARRMIQSSDNAATDALLAWVDTSKVQEAAALLEMTSTTVQGGGAAGTATWWGYTKTTPADLVKMLGAIAPATPTGGSAIIHGGHRAYVRHLMAGVVPNQRWGVADPPLPGGVYTETKNGWGPLPDGYRLNSIGRVIGHSRNYTMAILTRSPRGFRYGRESINGVSEIVHEALTQPL
ncbi:hypothetical protein N802_07395 [Knoellia sinensis KCTC 19936]|uniref:Beta-lactamase class A catalytic domain-containing protein n=1 Tax=Knoellia sinensis KCTC 19936 TaxID=1385520 RepID=A0A0A0JD43_9MICO|nr:serine hydrolase [Knoellia sinensis]KGN33947.1 hypothetical protein N802_07395 [Knoellia sinensis KCTC 19936]